MASRSWPCWRMLGRRAAQDVDEVAGAERLPALALQPHDRGEELLGGHQSVPRLAGQHVSQLPHAPDSLPEVGEEVLATASDRLAQGEHRVEVLTQSHLERARSPGLWSMSRRCCTTSPSP